MEKKKTFNKRRVQGRSKQYGMVCGGENKNWTWGKTSSTLPREQTPLLCLLLVLCLSPVTMNTWGFAELTLHSDRKQCTESHSGNHPQRHKVHARPNGKYLSNNGYQVAWDKDLGKGIKMSIAGGSQLWKAGEMNTFKWSHFSFPKHKSWMAIWIKDIAPPCDRAINLF